jgi:hypothetical protein
MKKILILFVVLFVCAGGLFAADIDLGDFPVGKWKDANYDAIWDFASNNIRILDANGAVLYDFADKTINDFKFFLDGTTPGISFSCVESEKSYRFLKPLINTDVVMEITRTDYPLYTVTMAKQ